MMSVAFNNNRKYRIREIFSNSQLIPLNYMHNNKCLDNCSIILLYILKI